MLEIGGRTKLSGAVEIDGRFVAKIAVEICGFVYRFLEFF